MTSQPATPARRARRADARQNYDRLVAVARDAFAAHGADASLIEIARQAGVSSGTLYRHFADRSALLAAVYRDEIETLAVQADSLRESALPLEALTTWLRAFSVYTMKCRGLKGLIATADSDALASWWHARLLPAAASLVQRAQQVGVIRADVTALQLLRLVNAVALAHEQAGPDDDQSGPLLTLIIDGLRHRDRADTP
jgi:AcrR family transcriptional regulator